MKEVHSSTVLYQLISKLAPDPQKVSEWVSELKKENPRLGKQELADYIGDYVVRNYTKQGIALALPGAIPGLGTVIQVATEIGATSVDVALMLRNQTYLIFAFGECFGRRGRDMLIQDTLICMGLCTNALTLTKSGVIRIGSKVLQANLKKRFPAKILQAINKKVGTTIITKYGTKRGGVALSKMIPFGVGTALGGGFNYVIMKHFKSSAIKYFSLKVTKPIKKTKALKVKTITPRLKGKQKRGKSKLLT